MSGGAITRVEARRRVRAALADLRPRLGLDRWLLHVEYRDLQDSDDGAILAQTTASATYREATLTFDLDKLTSPRHSPYLWWIVAHELSHCHTARLQDLARWAFERLLKTETEAATVDLERLPGLRDHLVQRSARPSRRRKASRG